MNVLELELLIAISGIPEGHAKPSPAPLPRAVESEPAIDGSRDARRTLPRLRTPGKTVGRCEKNP